MKVINLVLLTILLTSVSCWWEKGHMLVAKIGQTQLRLNHQEEALEKFNLLIKAFENLTDGRTNTFTEAAVWPDDIKEYNATFFNDYHFTDIAYDPQFLFVGMTEQQKDINSINVMGSATSVLKTNKEGITFERAFMARFLLHLVGDIHQPLHSTCMYNQTFKTGDLGGNRVIIETRNYGTMNLHAFLDAMAGQQDPNVRPARPLNAEDMTKLQMQAENLMNSYPPESFGNLTHQLSAHSWAVESYNAAVKDVYPFVFENKQTTEEWQQQMRDLCNQRVALGGYRLANVIASIYA